MPKKSRRKRSHKRQKHHFHQYPKRSIINLVFLLVALIVAIKLAHTILEIREKAVPTPPHITSPIPQPITNAEDLAKPGTDIYSQETIIEDFPPEYLESQSQSQVDRLLAPSTSQTSPPPPPMDKDTLVQKVLVVIYNTSQQPPYNPYYDPTALSQLLASYLEQASLEKGYTNPHNFRTNVDIQIVDTIEHETAPPRLPGTSFADYHAIIDSNQICQQVNNGTIDEVWLWADGSGGFYEGIMAGPSGSVFNTVGPPVIRNDCQKATHLMGLNYELYSDRNPITGQFLYPSTLKNLHAFLHRAENVIALTLDGRNRSNVQPGDTWFEFDGQIGYSGVLHQNRHCGNAHFAANALSLEHDYDYDLQNIVFSDCATWNPQHTGELEAISCTNWDCHEQYYLWWFQNFPGRCTAANLTQTDGSPMPSWWELFYKNRYVYPESTCEPPEPPPGDLDSDFDVDYLDYLISVENFITLGIFDFQSLISNFGTQP